MSIFDSIARAFKGSKEPTAAQIKTLLAKAEVEVAEASASAAAIEARLPTVVMAGEEGVAAHREETRKAAEKFAYLKQAQLVLVEKLAAAEEQEAEDARRATYDKAAASQREAQAALLARYEPAISELKALQAAVAAADELARIANSDLPEGAERLLETEAVRDYPGNPREIVKTEIVELWCGSSGDPIEDQGSVRRTGADTGVTYAASVFGNRAVPVHLRKFEKITVKPWGAPSYAARLADLELPALKADPVPPASPITEFAPIDPPAEAAE